MQNLALIIFDLDGVLVDSSPAHAAAYDELYRALGVQGRPYGEIAGRSTRSVVAELIRERNMEAGSLERWVAFKQEAARRNMDRPGLVFPDVAAALDALRALPVTVAIGTSASRATTRAVLRAAGWEGRFVSVVTSDDVRAGKPDPEIFRTVLERTGVSADATLIVEDSGAGLRAALSSGAWVVSVRTGAVVDGDRFLGSFPDLDSVIALATDGMVWTTSS